MARTQVINYGNSLVLPILVGAAYTPVPPAVAGVTPTKAANELFPARLYHRIGALVKNTGSNAMTITAPSGSVYPLAAGATIGMENGFFMEDGAYTITGTATDTFNFWEAY